MKKEKSSVAAEAKAASLSSLGPGMTKLDSVEGGDLPSPPPIKSDPDGPPSVKTNSVNGENNCDTSMPPTPTGVGEGGPATPSSLDDMKPPAPGGPHSQGPPSNCNNGGAIKSETDSFLDTFDSKDGGKSPPVCPSVSSDSGGKLLFGKTTSYRITGC